MRNSGDVKTAMIEANTPAEFENRFHSENPSNVFRPFYAEEFKIATVTSYFEFVFEKYTDREIKL